MNQISDAKIRRFGADYKELAVFFIRLLRLKALFATKERSNYNNCRKSRHFYLQRNL